MRAPYATAYLIPPCTGAVLGLLLQGCTPLPPDPASALSDTPLARSSAPAPEQELLVVRQGRYTLVEQGPELAQRNLMRQVVDVSIPTGADRTVGEALRYVLIRSGFSLCETQEAAQLYALPLPAAHLQLGPLPLRDALQTLAGPAWTLQVDSLARRVCFAPASHPSNREPAIVRVRASFLAMRADRLQRLGGAAWLLALSILIVHDHMGQSRLRQQLAQHNDQPRLHALQADIASLTARLDALPTLEHLVSPTELSAVREDLEASLAAVVQRQEKHAQAADVLTLQQRTDRLEARLQTLMHQATAPREKRQTPARPAPKAKASKPPFHLLGAEQRGGHTFLSLLPAHQQGLNAVTLLRVGESLGHWQLTGLSQDTATFRVDGQARRLPLPGGNTR